MRFGKKIFKKLFFYYDNYVKSGVLLINKERDWTSRDVCNKVKKLLHVDATGHSGTLDPFATGLLIVTINNANKIVRFLDDGKKTYEASLLLGKKTLTGDLNGEVVEEKDVPTLEEKKIIEVLNSFKGKIKQIPPMTSAVHYQGRKLYQLYYEGEIVEREPREVEVFNIELTSFKDNILSFKATVGSGTYIRVLGEDIALKLGTVGHLISLNRSQIGSWDLSKAIKVNDVDEESELIPISDFLNNIPHYQVDDEMKKKITNGMSLYLNDAKGDKILVVDSQNIALAIYERRNERNLYHCLRGLW